MIASSDATMAIWVKDLENDIAETQHLYIM
jgi:hypothetical protein